MAITEKTTSWRDKAKEAHRQRVEVLPSLYSNLSTDPEREANLKERVAQYDQEIFDKENERANMTVEATTPEEFAASDALIAEIETMKAERNKAVVNEYSAFRVNTAAQASFKQVAAERELAAISDKILETPAQGGGNPNNNAFTPLVYNASAVRENYFSAYINRAAGTQLMKNTNQPGQVSKAADLWNSTAGSKGMIVTSEQVLKAWGTSPTEPDPKNPKKPKENWGFQFQYNPGTVAMSYYTSPNVDVTMMTSGTEKFNLAGVSSSQGSVSFQIVINRIFDMQYYDTNGNLLPGMEERYPKPPSKDEEKELYNKGTMYDVEYILRVLMSTTMSSYLRGERTADMGWLPAIPVELHLGKSLRYLGIVNDLSLNHIIFDERMVPLFTTMNIGFARLPDYPPSDPSSAGKAV